MINRALPHPILTIFLCIGWMTLNTSFSMGHFVLGLLLGVIIPIFTSSFWEEKITLQKPLVLFKFFLVVMRDIVVSNVVVAKLILGKNENLHPGFATIDLDIEHPFGISILANTISLTPGTVSCDLSKDRKHLTLHFLDLKDPQSATAHIKNRYEKPLMEVFKLCSK